MLIKRWIHLMTCKEDWFCGRFLLLSKMNLALLQADRKLKSLHITKHPAPGRTRAFDLLVVIEPSVVFLFLLCFCISNWIEGGRRRTSHPWAQLYVRMSIRRFIYLFIFPSFSSSDIKRWPPFFLCTAVADAGWNMKGEFSTRRPLLWVWV